MEVLWAADAARPDTELTGRDVAAALPHHAYTTVLTVLDRLERKGLVRRSKAERTHRYAPAAAREAYIAELMREALGSTTEPDAALARFVSTVSPDEARVLRAALDRADDRPPPEQ